MFKKKAFVHANIKLYLKNLAKSGKHAPKDLPRLQSNVKIYEGNLTQCSLL
jgi:hypothetical protein